RRGNKYDIIIMDPPSFGRGSKNEVWFIENDLNELIEDTSLLLSEEPLLFIINSYTTGFSKTVLENLLYIHVNEKCQGIVSSDELGVPMKDSKLILPCGIYARWEKK
ncbi:MAG: SAM-dependent methyltransferase, partial [Bacilli bacterium]|nr:SAM-dependent methyltransferase [Bacilli bacterium]